jgi:UvrD/REP helicase N-terminal domain
MMKELAAGSSPGSERDAIKVDRAGQTPTPGSEMSMPDVDQRRVLDDHHERLLIVAPPGSGKTRLAVQLVARDVDAGRVGLNQRALVLTFSRDARVQLESYATQLLSYKQRSRVEITNYHAWFWRQVSRLRDSLELPELELATEAQREIDVVGSMSAEGVELRPRDRRQLGDYSRALEYELPGARPERLARPRPRSDAFAARLRELHVRTGRIHFDDLAYYTWLLLGGPSDLLEQSHASYPVIVLDEYQDSSPLQAAIVERIAGDGARVYAFADPLQQIYEWRDASKWRLEEFRASRPSEHRLRTLHRYRDRHGLQEWMVQARAVLLGEAAAVTARLPPEIEVLRYDPRQPERGKVWGAEARELWQLDGPISRAFRSGRRRRSRCSPAGASSSTCSSATWPGSSAASGSAPSTTRSTLRSSGSRARARSLTS